MQETRDSGSIPGLGRSPGGGHGNPLQYTCLENPMDREAWRATVHGVTKSRTLLKRLTTPVLYRRTLSSFHPVHNSLNLLIRIPNPSLPYPPPLWQPEVCSLCLKHSLFDIFVLSPFLVKCLASACLLTG